MHSKNIPAGANDSFETQYLTVNNRTGGALVVGGVYALDQAQAEAESTTVQTAFHNLIAVATASLKNVILVVAQEAAADNAQAVVIVSGFASVRVESTTDVTKGDPLKGVNTQNYLVKAASTGDRIVAYAGTTVTADSAAVQNVLFDGWPSKLVP